MSEFYVGYEPEMPSGLASRIRMAARGLVACALLLPAVFVLTQERFSAAVFEFGQTRIFEGRIIEHPYPALLVSTPSGSAATYWLVGQGKHGAADLVEGRGGQHVRVSGSLIQRDGDAMIEVAPHAIAAPDVGSSLSVEPLRSLGAVILQGEIVDSKCHLGVMKPGEGPTHRDCAVRCLLGSIPPMFVPHNRRDIGRLAMVSIDGRPFAGADAWAGRPVAIRGEVLERGAQKFLALAPADIRILDR